MKARKNKSSAPCKESGKPYPIQKQQKALCTLNIVSWFLYVIYIVYFTVINESSLPKYRIVRIQVNSFSWTQSIKNNDNDTGK